MLDFLLGTAVLALPQGNLALLAGIGAVKGAGGQVPWPGYGAAAAAVPVRELYLMCGAPVNSIYSTALT